MRFRTKHFLTLQELRRDELEDLVEGVIKAKEKNHFSGLEHKTILGFFPDHCIYSRLSLEAAVKKLGGSIVNINFSSEKWNLLHESGVMCLHPNMAHIRDAAAFLDTCGDALAIRHLPYTGSWRRDRQDSLLRYITRYSSIPIINLESNLYNPLQGLADLVSVKELLKNFNGWKAGIVWTYHPYAHGVGSANEFALAASKLGMDLTVSAPKGFELDSGIVKLIDKNTAHNRSSFEVSNKMDDALSGAHIVYAMNWRSCKHYADRAAEEVYQKQFDNWVVKSSDMEKTDGAFLLHPYPIRRNVCVMEKVLNSKSSMINRQIENKAYAQKYILSERL